MLCVARAWCLIHLIFFAISQCTLYLTALGILSKGHLQKAIKIFHFTILIDLKRPIVRTFSLTLSDPTCCQSAAKAQATRWLKAGNSMAKPVLPVLRACAIYKAAVTMAV